MYQLELLVYVIGVDRLTTRAIAADLPAATFRRRQPLTSGGQRRGRRPDLLLLDVSATDPYREVRAAWSSWDEFVVVVGVDGRQPFARVWRHQHLARIVELCPNFLAPYLGGRDTPARR